MSTVAPTAMGPALSARSTFFSVSRMASSVLPRTYVSSVASAGTTFTPSPARVGIGGTPDEASPGGGAGGGGSGVGEGMGGDEASGELAYQGERGGGAAGVEPALRACYRYWTR